MYRCNKCGFEFNFSQMAVWPEMVSRPERAHAVYEMMTGCPRCRCIDLTELFECAMCGQQVTYDELDVALCPDCQAAAERSVMDWYDEQSAPFQSWFESHYDGGEL